MKARFESKIEYRRYCENCRAEYMSSQGEGCPVCKNKEPAQEPKKENRKGSDRND